MTVPKDLQDYYKSNLDDPVVQATLKEIVEKSLEEENKIVVDLSKKSKKNPFDFDWEEDFGNYPSKTKDFSYKTPSYAYSSQRWFGY